jgi:adenylyltransferase/sulfurtransferase
VDLLENTTHRLAIDPRQHCAVRGSSCEETARRSLRAAREEAVLDVRFGSLEDAIQAGFHLVDVRNAEEIAAEPLTAPSQWLPAPDLPARGRELPSNAPVLLVCASGRRSGRTARQLRAQGMENVFSLAGGIRAILL